MSLATGLQQGIDLAFTWRNVAASAAGVTIGTTFGIFPGFGPTTLIAILLGFTVGLPPDTGIIMLVGIYFGTQYGDSISAILMRAPSEPNAVMLALDGHEIARRGRPGPALAVAAMGSFVGSLVGLVGLGLAAPSLGHVATYLSSADYTSIAVFGIVALSVVSPGARWRNLTAMLLGVTLSTVGLDPVAGIDRFTFGNLQLAQGIPIAPVAIGVFGFAEVLAIAAGSAARERVRSIRFRDIWPNRAEVKEALPASARGAFIGFPLGVPPGPTLAVATYASHALERAKSRRRHGDDRPAIAAVAGPKAADEAAVAGHLVTMVALGLAFSPVTAMLLSGLELHGIQPGPLFIAQHASLFWGIVISILIGSVILLVINVPLIGVWVQLLRTPTPELLAGLTVFMLTGAYAIRNSTFDMWIVVAMGAIGYVMRRYRFPAALLVIGLVLGSVLEVNLREALATSRGDVGTFVQHPVSATLLALSVVLVATAPLWNLAGRWRATRVSVGKGDGT